MKYVRLISMLLLPALLAACGGGGSGSAGGDSPASTTTTVAGVAMKGPFKQGAIVKVYPVIDGLKGSTPIARGNIGANSAYSVNVGDYSGAVVVEVSGEYTDEITGAAITVPESAPLHAAIANVVSGNSFTAQVTPLTELAYRQAGTLTSENITDANNLISSIMRVDDIIRTAPVPAASADFWSSDVSDSQRKYALILAAVAQRMTSAGQDLETTLAELNSGISTTATATLLTQALSECITEKKLSFYDDSSDHAEQIQTLQTSLENIGTITKLLTVALVARPGVDFSTVKGLQTTLTLPAGLILRTDANGAPLAGVVKLTGSAAAAAASESDASKKPVQFVSRYDASTGTLKLALLSVSDNFKLAAGDIITIHCYKGITPLSESYILSGSTDFWDADGKNLVFSDSNSTVIAPDSLISVH